MACATVRASSFLLTFHYEVSEGICRVMPTFIASPPMCFWSDICGGADTTADEVMKAAQTTQLLEEFVLYFALLPLGVVVGESVGEHIGEA